MKRGVHKEGALAGTLVLLAASTFILDVLTPLSFAVHVLYAAVVLLATTSRWSWTPLVTAGLSAILTITAGFFSPPLSGVPEWIPIGNRLLTMIMLFILGWFSLKRREAEMALQEANEGLEAKVRERTQELAGVNQALVSEVTERMQAEHAFRLSEGRLAGILDLAEDAIIVIDQDRAIGLFNQGAVKLFGYEPHEILGAPIDRLLTEPLYLETAASAGLAAPAAEPGRRLAHPRDVLAVRRDGTAFPAEASVSKLTVGHKTTWTIILRDLTDRLRAEEQLHSLTTQLINAQEEERRRISRELHDDINQRLALVAIEMGGLD